MPSRPADPFYLAVGRRIQDRRDRKGITQGGLGELLAPSVTRASIANLENGKQRLLLHTFLQIAEILDCDLRDLLPVDRLRDRQANVQSQLTSELGRHGVPERVSERIRQQFLVAPKREVK